MNNPKPSCPLTKVDDRGLKAVARLPRLEVLKLDETKVTDEGLRALGGLKQLRDLSLRGTEVTPQAIADLRRARPQLKVVK